MRHHWAPLRLTLVLITILVFVFTSSANILDNEISDDSVGDGEYDLDLGALDFGFDLDDDDVVDELPTAFDEGEVVQATKYEPKWSSLDTRPLPRWYDQAKIGIFIHWGVFSVPAFGGAWFWKRWADKSPEYVQFMKENYPPSFTYQDFGPQFTAQFYNASAWVELFAKAGARYVVLTSKHHDGYTNWPSKYSFGWNSMDVGPKRDLVGELATAMKKLRPDMKFGLYHSLFEFFNPLYLNDNKLNFTSSQFVDFKTMPELYELVNKYEPQVIWSDGDWEAYDSYWKSKEFLAWLYNESPVKDSVLVNDRWGIGVSCKHGDFYNCQDHYNPHKLQAHKWENAFTVDKSYWAYREVADVAEYRSVEELISEVVTTVSCGGNVLLNVGPTKEGTIIPIMQERLLQLGAWLEVNGEGIYGSRPWPAAQQDGSSKFIWYTVGANGVQLYAMALTDWTEYRGGHELLELGSIDLGKLAPSLKLVNVTLLGYPSWPPLSWELGPAGKGVEVKLPEFTQFRQQIKSPYGWTLVLTFQPGRSGGGGGAGAGAGAGTLLTA